MTAPKTLPSYIEEHILLTQQQLKKLEVVQDIIRPASYKATQREVLRNLVKRCLTDLGRGKDIS